MKRAHVWPSDASATVQIVAQYWSFFWLVGLRGFAGVFEKTGRKTCVLVVNLWRYAW